MTIHEKQAQHVLLGKVDWNPLLEGFVHIACGEDCWWIGFYGAQPSLGQESRGLVPALVYFIDMIEYFFVQKGALCRKTNINTPLREHSHSFSTTHQQGFVECRLNDDKF